MGEHHRWHGPDSADRRRGRGGRRKVARVWDHVPAVAQGKRPEVWQIRRGRGVARGVAPFAVQVLPVHGAEHGRGCHPVHENADVHAHGGDCGDGNRDDHKRRLRAQHGAAEAGGGDHAVRARRRGAAQGAQGYRGSAAGRGHRAGR